MFFQGDSSKLTQEKVIQLYDKRIAEAVNQLKNKELMAVIAKATTQQ